MGLEADGTVKGCPSLPTVGYTGGNVRTLRLEDIWNQAPEIHFGRLRSVEDLWGACRTCYYADVCRGGCTWTAHSLFGRPGNNPYCHYRALDLEKRGLRERVVKRREASKASFAIGEFELVVEPIPGREARAGEVPEPPGPTEVPAWRLPEGQPLAEGRVPPSLSLCRGCFSYLHAHETHCPHCGVDLAEAEARHAEDVRRRRSVMAEVRRLLSGARSEGTS
jgi:radical SAM protein with 4Fe4S-binding SPASM domain